MPAGYQVRPAAKRKGLPGGPGKPVGRQGAEWPGSLRRAGLHAVVELTLAGGDRLAATVQLPQVPAVVPAREAELLVRIEALNVVGVELAGILRSAAPD